MNFKLNPKLSQKIAYAVLFLSTIRVIIPVLIIVFNIVKNGYAAISWEFLTTMPKDGMRAGGILPAILGTLSIVLCAIMITLPVGVCAAIYLNEYAKDNLLTRIIKLAIVNLAGVPQ
jgi:phosphate transport system permease protein